MFGCWDSNNLLFSDEFDLEASRYLQPDVYTGHYYYNLMRAAIQRLRLGQDVAALSAIISREDVLTPQGEITTTTAIPRSNGTTDYYALGWACLRGSEQQAILEFSIEPSDGSAAKTLMRRRPVNDEVFELKKGDVNYAIARSKCSIPGIASPFSQKKMWGYRVKLPIGEGYGGDPIIAKVISPFHRLHLPTNGSKSQQIPEAIDAEMDQSGLIPLPGLICGAPGTTCLCTPNRTYTRDSVKKVCSANGMSWQ
jgi:hypothetical protein